MTTRLKQYQHEFQTRTDDGALAFYKTLAAAMKAAKKDPEVWKVSFSLPTGESVRLTKNSNGKFEYEPIVWKRPHGRKLPAEARVGLTIKQKLL